MNSITIRRPDDWHVHLRDGDVLTSLGGRPVTGADDLDRIARDFAAGGNVPVVVERGQDTVSLAIPVAGPRP